MHRSNILERRGFVFSFLFLWEGFRAMILSEQHFEELFTPPEGTYNALNRALERSAINDVYREMHFLAQCAYESGGFRSIEENLNYNALRLIEVFPSKFNEKNAPLYAFKPEKIANFVYANKNGNGDEASGDGWRFKGRGYIQVTGRNNYIAIDMRANAIPGVSWTKLQAAKSSVAWWLKNDMNKLCTEFSLKACSDITKRVNGSTETAYARYLILNKILYFLSFQNPSLMAEIQPGLESSAEIPSPF
jgi:putative chitinase